VNTATNNFRKGFSAVIAGAVAIGSAAIFMRLSDVSPTSAAFWRVTLALPLLFIWMRADAGSRVMLSSSPKKGLIRSSMIVGFWFAADMFLWHWSVEKTTVANATLLANMATIFTALAGFLFFRQRFSGKFIAGLALAVMGAAALVGQNASINPNYLVGDMLGIATAVAYAGYIIFAAKVRGTLTTPIIMFGSAVTTALFLLPIALMEDGSFLPATAASWLPLIGLAWLTHVLGQSLIIYGLAHVPAALGSVTLLIQPVISALLAWWLFAEALGVGHLVGAILIFSGIALARKGAGNKEQPTPKKAKEKPA
jgi:drug/metabolite transporter (DMT)-like permease